MWLKLKEQIFVAIRNLTASGSAAQLVAVGTKKSSSRE